MNERPSKRRPTRRAAAIVAAVALVVGGAVTAVVVTKAEAEETARQCAAALELTGTAATQAKQALANADASLTAVEAIALPATEGWTSGPYADRPEGAVLISTVIDARATLEAAAVPNDCTDRGEAEDISGAALIVTDAVASLDEQVAALAQDFEVFQIEETARVAAEVEAARIAAEEAARKAAEEAEAARVAAEAEAARQAAAQRQAWRPSGGGGNQGSAPPVSNGGSFGVGTASGNDATCLTDNGMGGTRPCD